MVVVTTSGPVRGRRIATGSVFLGVPYAAGPVGAQRFAAPAPHAPWTDVRDATRPGPTAPQPARDAFGVLDMSPYFGPGWVRGTDYLTVNIWSPQPAETPAPVMVFVHGGGFVAGSSNSLLYDGTSFARDGVVLVTLNYRLGIPGFLHLDDAPGNRGMLDVLAALNWLRDNVSRFGGDPANITLFGQSAGAIIVAGVLADPAATGLVHRAILQSGSGTAAFTPEQAGKVTAAVGQELGLVPTVRALADVSDERFTGLIPGLSGLDLRVRDHHDPLGGITQFSLVLDEQPATTARADGGLLIGTNRDEGALYLAPLGLLAGTTDHDVHATAAKFHPRPDELAPIHHGHPGAAESRVAILGDGLFGAGTRRMTEAHARVAPTYVYSFAWRSNALAGQLGASHVMELPLVFDRLDLMSLRGPNALLGTGELPRELATAMHAAWIRFAATGDPGWPSHPHIQQLGTSEATGDHGGGSPTR
jgi:para-nitrobenzyl esterase